MYIYVLAMHVIKPFLLVISTNSINKQWMSSVVKALKLDLGKTITELLDKQKIGKIRCAWRKLINISFAAELKHLLNLAPHKYPKRVDDVSVITFHINYGLFVACNVEQ